MQNTYGIIDIKKDFYNLPFTPELITKFFKGWEKNKSPIAYINEENTIDFEKLISENKYIIFDDEEYTIHHKPLVLNDFIRDCERAKIELEM